MDDRSFGAWSKRVAAAVESRRGVLDVVSASVAAALGVAMVRQESAEAAFGFCRVGGFPCGKNQQCCTSKCQADGTCSCAKRGKPCINRVGANCCSRRCRKGKCK